MDDTAEIGERSEEQKPPEVVLQIRLTSEGQLLVTGKVIENEPLALWLLNRAEDIIKAHNLQLAHRRAEEDRPKVTPGNMMNFARNVFRRK
jgi:hypothetical protein